MHLRSLPGRWSSGGGRLARHRRCCPPAAVLLVMIVLVLIAHHRLRLHALPHAQVDQPQPSHGGGRRGRPPDGDRATGPDDDNDSSSGGGERGEVDDAAVVLGVRDPMGGVAADAGGRLFVRRPEHHKERPNHGAMRLDARELLLRMAEVPIQIIRDHLLTAFEQRVEQAGQPRVVSIVCSIAGHQRGGAPTTRALALKCYDSLGQQDTPRLRTIRVRAAGGFVPQPTAHPTPRPVDVIGQGNNTFFSTVCASTGAAAAVCERMVKQAAKMQELAKRTVVTPAAPYPDVAALLHLKVRGTSGGVSAAGGSPACPLSDAPPGLDAMLRAVLPVTLGVHVLTATALQEALSRLAAVDGGAAVARLHNLFANAERTMIIIDARHSKTDSQEFDVFADVARALSVRLLQRQHPAHPLAQRLKASGMSTCAVTPLISDLDVGAGASPLHPARVPGERAPPPAVSVAVLPDDAAATGGSDVADLYADTELLLGGVQALEIECGARESPPSVLYDACERQLFEREQLDAASEALAVVLRREQLDSVAAAVVEEGARPLAAAASVAAARAAATTGSVALPRLCSELPHGALRVERALKFGTKTAIYTGTFAAGGARPAGRRGGPREMVAVKHFNLAQYGTFTGFHALMRSSSRSPLINYPTSSCLEPSASDSVLQLQPLVEGINLKQFIKKRANEGKGIGWPSRVAIALQIACIFQYLHAHPPVSSSDGDRGASWFVFDDNHPEQYLISVDSTSGAPRVKLVDIDTLQLAVQAENGGAAGGAGGAAAAGGGGGGGGGRVATRCRCFYCDGRANCVFINTREGYRGCRQSAEDPQSGAREPPHGVIDPAARRCDGTSDAWFVAQLLYFIAEGHAPWQGAPMAQVITRLERGEVPALRSKNKRFNNIVNALFQNRTADAQLVEELSDLCREMQCPVEQCPPPETATHPYTGLFN